MPRHAAEPTVPVTLARTEDQVAPRVAMMLARLVEGQADLDRLNRFSARFEVAGERVRFYVTAPVRLGRTP